MGWLKPDEIGANDKAKKVVKTAAKHPAAPKQPTLVEKAATVTPPWSHSKVDVAVARAGMSSWSTALHATNNFEFVSVATRPDIVSLADQLLSDFPLKVQILGLGTVMDGSTPETSNEHRRLALLSDYLADMPERKI